MKKANGTMLAFICLMGLVLCAGVTAANIDSQQLKSFYDRMQNQRDSFFRAISQPISRSYWQCLSPTASHRLRSFKRSCRRYIIRPSKPARPTY